MISIKNTLSEDLLEQEFVCDLSACKGACCVAGDGGAPLNEEELETLDRSMKMLSPTWQKGVKGVDFKASGLLEKMAARKHHWFR